MYGFKFCRSSPIFRHNNTQDSAYVFGVANEYGVLEVDEVFINLPGCVGVVTRPEVVVCRYASISKKTSIIITFYL